MYVLTAYKYECLARMISRGRITIANIIFFKKKILNLMIY